MNTIAVTCKCGEVHAVNKKIQFYGCGSGQITCKCGATLIIN